MSTVHEKPVSLRKFAAMTGTSDGGVRKAIGKGSISAGVVDGKILPSVASVEWGKGIFEVWALSDGEWREAVDEAPSEEAVAAVVISEVGISISEFGEDAGIPDLAYTDGGEAEPVVYTGDEDVLNDTDDAAEFMRDIPQGTPKIEAERLYSVFRARKIKRELQKLEGELVDKGLVYKNLYEFAAIIRDKFMNVPDRVVDNILAADTRNEAIKVLSDEITEVLVSLATVGSIKLTASV